MSSDPLKSDLLLLLAMGSLLMVAYALLWVSSCDWEMLPRLKKLKVRSDPPAWCWSYLL